MRCDFQRMIENKKLEKGSEDSKVVLCFLHNIENLENVSFKI